jgi:hypothetical protein
MAYGNWGAFVYKNGERQETHEDNLKYIGQGLPGEPVDVPSMEGRTKQEAFL